MTLKALWSVSLSDGTNLHEGKGDFAAAEGRKSPWLRLSDYLSEKGLKITSLSLYCGDLRWNLPSMGNSPKFKSFADLPKPVSYRFERRQKRDVYRSDRKELGHEEYSVIRATYGDGSEVQLWVREGTLASWTAYVPNNLSE